MFDSGYLAHFLPERDENWQGYGCDQLTLILHTSSILVPGSSDTMQQHALSTDALVSSVDHAVVEIDELCRRGVVRVVLNSVA